MRLLAIVLWTLSIPAWAQYCLDDSQCRSQLLRVQVASNVLGGNASYQQLLTPLRSLASSGLLQSALEQRPFPLPEIGFPHFRDVCRREKAEGDPLFQSIDCEAEGLCRDTSMDPTVRRQMCFSLPCPILEGNLQPGRCNSVESIHPTAISFPQPLQIERIRLEPTRIENRDGRVHMCVNLSELSLSMGIGLNLDTTGTNLADRNINVTNIRPVLDRPREVCLSARVDLTAENPVSDIQLDLPGGSFISDDMIREASRQLRISGVAGYAPGDVQAIQEELVPVLVHPLRASIEDGLKKSLSKTFETKLQEIVGPLTEAGEGTSIYVNSRSMLSELGVANLQVYEPLAVAECAYLQLTGERIPANHECIGKPAFMVDAITPNTIIDPAFPMMELLGTIRAGNITSGAVRNRLIALKERVARAEPFISADTSQRTAELTRQFHADRTRDRLRDLDDAIAQIEQAQMNHSLFDFVELQSQLSSATSGASLSIPEICSLTNPSPHEGRRMNNCPIQVYMDLNELNTVIRRMWETGRMCQSGQGPFVPRRNQAGEIVRDSNGQAVAAGGCYMNLGGLGCYVDQPPQLSYVASSRRYAVPLRLKNCYHGGFFGMADFGTDLNIDFNFRPKACHNGDFCIDSPRVTPRLVSGTQVGALNPNDGWGFLSGTIRDAINDGIIDQLGHTIRVPLASASGMMENIPLRAQGRVDYGDGYFGACLEVAP